MILILDILNQARNLTLNQDFLNQFQAIPAYQVETGINGKNGLCLETSKIINSLCKTLDKTMTTLLEDLTMTKEVTTKYVTSTFSLFYRSNGPVLVFFHYILGGD